MTRAAVNCAVFTWHLPSGGIPRVIAEELRRFPSEGINANAFYVEGSLEPYYRTILPGRMLKRFPASESVLKIRPSLILDQERAVEFTTSGLDVPALISAVTLRGLARVRPDVVVCHELASAVAALLYCTLGRKPYIVILHDNPYGFLATRTEQRRTVNRELVRAAKWLAKRVLRGAFAVVCTTQHIDSELSRVQPLRTTTVAQYGMSADCFEADYKTRKIVLTVSKWSAERKPEVYLDLISRIPNSPTLVVAGHWENSAEREAFDSQIRNRGLMGRVLVASDIPDEELTRLYRSARVFVRFGFGEYGTGQGIFEALGYGCPVVINEGLGASELIRDGVHGFIVRDGDLDAAAYRVQMLLADPALGSQMSGRCKSLASANSWETYVRTLGTIVKEAARASRDGS